MLKNEAFARQKNNMFDRLVFHKLSNLTILLYFNEYNHLQVTSISGSLIAKSSIP